ncbi:MAG: LysM peptidoglycan-binding domain-containing protein, partial [Bacteroidaceae bacterium]|nr:LysM peptidoglycan-binding domain-containing protein [Bacteroidaceae bacterium]
MKTLKNILGTLLLTFALSMGAYAQENQSYIMHTIEKGQTLTSISSMYGVSIDDIVKLNPGSDTTIIEGKQLRIPRRPSNQ